MITWTKHSTGYNSGWQFPGALWAETGIATTAVLVAVGVITATAVSRPLTVQSISRPLSVTSSGRQLQVTAITR